MTSRIEEIADRLYVEPPTDILFFHYTSISAFQSLLESGALWATDIRYFSDAAELTHLMSALHNGIASRPENPVLQQLSSWLSERLPRGNMVFAASFSAKGDLLSQWRAYCPPAKGVSLGFDPSAIVLLASAQSFSVGRCRYDGKEQEDLVAEILDSITVLATQLGEDPRRRATQSYYSVFEVIETPLLRIGALFKHPAFREEVEWRVVSPVLTDYVHSGIRYREGPSTLVPYLQFGLTATSRPVPLTTFR